MSEEARTFRHDEPGTAASTWRADPRWVEARPAALEDLVSAGDRLVVLAAHPDDETLGAGGLTAAAARAHRAVSVVVVTDGEGSHPASRTCTREELAVRRRAEVHAAASTLGVTDPPVLLGVPDGAVAEHDDLVARLVELVRDGRDTVLLAPWRRDGHPDHEALGRAAAVVAARTGARLLEYPVWAWHWATPDDLPWEAATTFRLDEAELDVKRRAIGRHRTQVAPLSDRPGDEVLLAPAFLEHFTGPDEVYLVEPVHDPALDVLHEHADEPWGADARWYEERKRDVVLALLPRRRFRHALELGCSTGHLARRLAERCDRVLAVDASAHAVAAARHVVPTGVVLRHCRFPEQWPEQRFDLVVLSEVGYFLSPRDLDETLRRVASSLSPDGVVVLCHWRHEVVGWPLDGPAVHGAALRADLRPVGARYVDRDVEVLVLCSEDQWPDPDE